MPRLRARPLPFSQLGSGEVFFDSALELDTDGWPDRADAGDPDWQPDTSLGLSDHSSLDANSVPYFVLPLGLCCTAVLERESQHWRRSVLREQVSYGVGLTCAESLNLPLSCIV